jgi:aminopeptidase N
MRARRRAAIAAAMRAMLSDEALDDLMRGELLILPPCLSGRAMACRWSPAWCRRARGLKAWLGASWASLCARHDRASAVPLAMMRRPRARARSSQVLVYLAAAKPGAAERAAAQYDAADNMTDRQGALTVVLCGLDSPLRELADFHARYQGNALVIDKWFSQAGSLHPRVLDHVKALGPPISPSATPTGCARYMALAINPSGSMMPAARVIA